MPLQKEEDLVREGQCCGNGRCIPVSRTQLRLWGDWMNDFDCAICVLEDYHDSDQYICDDCYRELESLKADQLASRWD